MLIVRLYLSPKTNKLSIFFAISLCSNRVQEEHARSPVNISHKKMAAEGGRIYFMFLGPSPYLAAGSTTEVIAKKQVSKHAHTFLV